MIFGIRAVIEAIEADKEIDKIMIKRGLDGDLARDLFAHLKGRQIPVQYVPMERLNRVTRKNHQGVIAFVSAVEYQHVENLVPMLFEEGKTPFFVLLDGVTDVRNFGSIARTCNCAGVDAIILPMRDSVSVNADAVKTSAGALLSMPVCREGSMVDTIKYLKNSGFTIVGATEKGAQDYFACDYSNPLCLVMGAEDTGIPADHLRLCDVWAKIPMYGTIASLNVSVAAAILIFEAAKQRNHKTE